MKQEKNKHDSAEQQKLEAKFDELKAQMKEASADSKMWMKDQLENLKKMLD